MYTIYAGFSREDFRWTRNDVKKRLDFEVCAALEVMAAGLRACD